MEDQRISINYGVSLENAEKIQTIVNNIDEAVKTLDNGFKKAGNYTELKWFTEMSEEWEHFCGNNIPATLAEMTKTKENIEKIVEEIQQYEG